MIGRGNASKAERRLGWKATYGMDEANPLTVGHTTSMTES